MKRRHTPKEKKHSVQRERDPIPWRYCLLALCCGLLLAVGFFWAARQHFLAMDFGMKNAKLREHKKVLEDEQSRLDADRENAKSPSEIKRLAKKFGLQDLTLANMAVVSAPKEKIEIPGNEANPKIKNSESIESEETAQKNNSVRNKSGDLKPTRPQIAKK